MRRLMKFLLGKPQKTEASEILQKQEWEDRALDELKERLKNAKKHVDDLRRVVEPPKRHHS